MENKLTRRSSLVALGGLVAGAAGWHADDAGAGPAAVASGAVACILTPEMTEGPYYVPGEAVRRTITEGRPGTPLALHLTVVNASTCRPIAHANVDVWHADALGVYSGVQGNTGTFMRGVQPTNAHGVALFDDLGSGSLVPLEDEPLVTESLAAGVDLVTFSGDKLLGGPQAGIVLGRAELVAQLRRHPLQRALRPDKLTLAALEGTLLLYAEPERALAEVPALRALSEPLERVRERAERLAALVGGEVVETTARAGGGALPLHKLPSAACAVELELAAALRGAEPPVIGLVRDEQTLLDCRTIADGEVELVAAAVNACR